MVTIEELQKALPSRKNTITDEIVEIINKSQDDPEFQGESLLQTAITYENVMMNNKAGIKEYIDAIRFCAYLISLEDNYTEAYKKTFSYRDFVKNRLDVPPDSSKYKELTNAASRYRRSKLVVDLLTFSQVPLDILFSGYRYKAIGVLANEMETAAYSRDRIAAAKELLLAVKGPENKKIELEIGVKESSAVANLNEQLSILASKQKMLLESGARDLTDFGSMTVNQEEIVDAELYS